jgi:thiamine-monophosphate kinase
LSAIQKQTLTHTRFYAPTTFAPMSEPQKSIESLGEFGLIDHLTQHIELNRSTTEMGAGDDAAIILGSDADRMLVSTDMLMEGVHFDISYVPLKHLGYKAIVVNLSDICAMNGKPEQVLVSLAISNKYPLEAVEELYAGMLAACKAYGVDLVGGDTTGSRSGLVISVTAIGRALPERIAKRSGARANDILMVSGDLGGAYMGLQVLQREKEVFMAAPTSQPKLVGYDYLLERQLKPEARKDVVDLLETLSIVPTSMIDISDGLASETLHLCRSSEVGCDLFEEKLPIDALTYQTAREFDLDPTICALNGGEDYELLFTIRQEDFDKIKDHPLVTPIGYMKDASSGSNLILRNGSSLGLKAQGWDAFAKR